MAITITVKNSNISGKGEILNRANIHGQDDIAVELDYLNISDHAEVLNDLQLNSVANEIEQKAQYLDHHSAEYQALQRILDEQHKRESFRKKLFHHAGAFAEGVAASVIASYLGK